MIKIAHFADTHINNEYRHDEYRKIFSKIYEHLNNIKPDRIVICGDLFESKLILSNEAKLLAGELLNNLSKISKVIITCGNHDLNIKNLNRVDSIKMIVKLINNPNVTYYDKSGIYQDNSISWVVYHHPEKNIDPWTGQTKNKDQIYIGLFHDPILNSTTNTGKIFNDTKYKDISYFENNDFLLMGDIHKRQFFRKNKSAAYCGSTLQLNFGESIGDHGFLLWNIETSTNFTVKEYDIENDHKFLNLYIDENTDYENLKLKIDNVGEDTDVKVHWKDLSSNITTANEKEIRDYIKENLNTTKVKFEKTFVYNDIIDSEMLSESLNLNDTDVQSNIFKEYLENQKYKKEDIDEILKIDEIINNRLILNNAKTNIQWSVDKFWFSNFKSYGDNNEINWKDNDGIFQIHGLNMEGKTTILDALTYILYGKTTTTLTPEKFGDSRYLNNKRDLDYCLGGAIIDVNGEKFTIQRKTERIWNKNKTAIVSCPTTLDFYKDEAISEKNKLTDKVRKKTQEKLDEILGDLKDFIRLSFTNADNLNDTLSETRSVFMDNIIRDAGYDVFETKLEEFKEYKKELSEEKIIIDIQEAEGRIDELNIIIENKKVEINTNKTLIENFELELIELNNNRDNFNKKLNNIDSSMINFDENINLDSIKNYESKIEEAKIQITILEREIKELPTNFISQKLNELKVKLKGINDKISERKDEISNLKNIITESDNKKDKVLAKIKELKDSEIRKLQLKISDNDLKIEILKNQQENIINGEIRNIDSEIQKIALQKNEISNKMKLLQKDGLNTKNANDELDIEIKKLKNSKTCPTCGRDYDKSDPQYSEHLEHLQENIDKSEEKKEDNNIKIQKFLSEYKKLKNILPTLDENEEKLKTEKIDLKNGIYLDEIKEKLKALVDAKLLKQENLDNKSKIEDIKNDNYNNIPLLKENLLKGESLLERIELNRNENLEVIKNIELELKNFNVESVENDIEIEEKLREKFELRSKKLSQKENLNLSIENFNLKIKDLQLEIDKYQEYKIKIEENNNIQIFINDINNKISYIKDNVTELTQENISLDKEILLQVNEIESISINIKKYLKQKKKEELLKEYARCVGRDGIPLYLLKKSIHLINNELNDLLLNVNFTLFFDENLILKMSANDRLDVDQPAITSSGMERTFCALALKIALRGINTKSKPSFIFLDEIMGKLISDSVQQFIDFLDVIKTKVKKVVIIEHIHPINYDAIINVHKDENLISHLELKY